jgi:predicted MFS family arabinose efflux permease
MTCRENQNRRENPLMTQSVAEKPAKWVLATITFSHLAQHFYVGLSVLYPEIMADLNLNYTQLGVMTGTTAIISGFLQLLWSILNRYVSRGVLLGIGNILMSMGCVVMGLANRFIDIIGGNVVSGSGQAAQHPVGTSIITRKFPRDQLSRALSIHYGLGYIGNIISPMLLSLIAVSTDWRRAIHVLAIIPFITGLTVLYYLRGEAAAQSSVQRGERHNLWDDLKSALRIKEVVLIIVAQAFAVGGTGMGVIITYTPLFLKNVLQVGTLDTSIIYSIAVLGGVVGTIAFGYVANKLGNLRTAGLVLALCSVLILLLTLHNSFTILLIPHLFVIGATSFSCSSLLQAHLAASSTPSQRDIIIGLYFTLSFGISSIWTTLTGFLIDAYGSFNPAWLLRAALGAVAFLLIMFTVYVSSSKPQSARANDGIERPREN